jgi:hypothetical protein
MITIFFISSLIALALLMWFKTDVWVEYTHLFHLDCLSFYKDFKVKQSMDASLTYHMYLRMYHNCFFVRLITCPICVAIWLGIFSGAIIFCSALLSGILSIDFVIVAIGTLSLIPIYTIGGILLYATIDKLMG